MRLGLSAWTDRQEPGENSEGSPVETALTAGRGGLLTRAGQSHPGVARRDSVTRSFRRFHDARPSDTARAVRHPRVGATCVRLAVYVAVLVGVVGSLLGAAPPPLRPPQALAADATPGAPPATVRAASALSDQAGDSDTPYLDALQAEVFRNGTALQFNMVLAGRCLTSSRLGRPSPTSGLSTRTRIRPPGSPTDSSGASTTSAWPTTAASGEDSLTPYQARVRRLRRVGPSAQQRSSSTTGPCPSASGSTRSGARRRSTGRQRRSAPTMSATRRTGPPRSWWPTSPNCPATSRTCGSSRPPHPARRPNSRQGQRARDRSRGRLAAPRRSDGGVLQHTGGGGAGQ